MQSAPAPTRSRRCPRTSALLALAAGATLATSALAVPRNWDNTYSSGDWNDPSRWSPNNAPQNGDDVLLTQGDAVNRTVNYVNPGGVSLNSIRIESTGSGLMTLVQNQDSLNANVLDMGVGTFGRGSYQLGGGTLVTGHSLIGVDGVGTLIQNGAFHNASQYVSLGDGTSGFGYYSVAGLDARLTTNELDVGYLGTGTVNHGAGTVSISDFIGLGVQVGSRGAYNMVGAGAAALSAQREFVGLMGTGSFVQSAGTNTVFIPGAADGVLSIGELENSVGTYTIGGNASLSAEEFDVALLGIGQFIQNGGTVNTVNANLASYTNTLDPTHSAIGTYTMNAGTFNTTDLTIAYQNKTLGTFNQSNGTVTVSRDLSIAYTTGSLGGYTIDGGTLTTLNLQVGANPETSGPLLGTGGTGTFIVNGGSVNVTGAMKVDHRSLARYSGGAFTANQVQITGGSRMVVGAGSGRTPVVKSLSITGNSRVDLNDQALIVDYDLGPSPLNTIAGYLTTGYAGGAWSGQGINTSVGSPTQFALGYAEASDVFGLSGAGTTDFRGHTIDATTVVVKYTYYGDANLDGRITFDDYVRIDTGFQTGRTGWSNGDFNYSGTVTFDDYVLIDINFNTQSGTLSRAINWISGDDRSTAGLDQPGVAEVIDHLEHFGPTYGAAFLAAVPEPAAASLLAATTLGLRRRRR